MAGKTMPNLALHHAWLPDADTHWKSVRCIGCQACAVACLIENNVPENEFRTFVSTYEIADSHGTGTYVLPRLCNHCSSPPGTAVRQGIPARIEKA